MLLRTVYSLHLLPTLCLQVRKKDISAAFKLLLALMQETGTKGPEQGQQIHHPSDYMRRWAAGKQGLTLIFRGFLTSAYDCSGVPFRFQAHGKLVSSPTPITVSAE